MAGMDELLELELPPPSEPTSITVKQLKEGGPVLVRKVMGRWQRSQKGAGLAEGDEIVRMGVEKELVDGRLDFVRCYIKKHAEQQLPLLFSVKKKVARSRWQTPTASQEKICQAKALAQENKTPDERKARQVKEAGRKAKSREKETPDERRARQIRDAETTAQARENETPDERRARLIKDAETTAQARENETQDERRARLEKIAEAMAVARENETQDERRVRLEKIAEAMAVARENESQEEREERRAKDRERQAKIRAEETEEARLLSLMKLRQRMHVVRRLRKEKPELFEKEKDDILIKATSYRDTLSEEGKKLYQEAENQARKTRRHLQSDVDTMLRLLNQVEKHVVYNAAVAIGVSEVNVLKRARNDDSMAAVTISQFNQIQLLKKRRREELERTRRAKAAAKNALPIGDIVEAGPREEIRKELCELFVAELRGSTINPCLSCEQLKNRGSLVRCTQKKLESLKDQLGASEQQASRKSTAAVHFKEALDCLSTSYNELGSLALLHPEAYGTADKPTGWICKTCWRSLKDGLAPALGAWNNLAPTFLPDDYGGGKSCLSQLDEVGRSLVARRTLFRRIITLPAGGQTAVKGGIINVPSNLKRTKEQMEERVFPLTPEEAEVQVETKRRVGDQRYIRRKVLNLRTVIGATQELHLHNHLYSDIKIRSQESWRKSVGAEDSELLDVLEGNEEGEGGGEEEVGEVGGVGEDERDPLLDVLLACVDGPAVSGAEAEAYMAKEAKSKARRGRGGKKAAFVVAPGEGETPIPLFMDENVEALAMPWLFPLGQNHFSSKREIPITRAQYIKNRLLHRDSRWREDSLFPYFAFYVLENERLIRSVSVNMTKVTASGKDRQPVTAGALQGDGLTEFIAQDKAFRYMKSSRGSPAYWNSSLLDLFGMIRQLGAPTWFVTLSADDRNWTDGLREAFKLQHNRIPSEDELTNMSGAKRNELLRKHAHVFARQFHSRVQAFTNVAKSDYQPLGKVGDYYYRVEWQKRGSPHIHGLLWVDSAPKLGEQSDEEVAAWVDKYVKATIPSEEENKELHDLVVNLQTHSHRPTCQRENIHLSKEEKESCKTEEEREALLKNKRCRFKYPRDEVDETFISYSDAVKEELDNQDQLAAAELAAEKERMVGEGSSEEETAEMETKMKEQAAFTRGKILQTSPVEINVKRGPNDVRTNNYNPEILTFWKANMDIQYVGNVYAAAQYISGYVAKAERALADEVKELSESLGKDIRQDTRWRKIACAFIKSRTISAQEVVHNILGLPYLRKSRRCLYIPTGFRDQRHRKLKSFQDRQDLPTDSKDVFVRNIIEHYEHRACCYQRARNPDQEAQCCKNMEIVEKLPLITFAAYYTLLTKDKAGAEEEEAEEEEMGTVGPDFEEGGYVEEDDDEDEEHVDLDAMEALPKYLYETVERDRGDGTTYKDVFKYRKRIRQAVVRFHHFNPDTESENWAYSNILLFYPFRLEQVDLNLERRQQLVKEFVVDGGEDGDGYWVERPARTYEEWFRELCPSLEKAMSHYAAFSEMIAEAMRNLNANAELAYALEQGDLERVMEGDEDEVEAPDIDFLREMLNPGEDFDFDPFDQAGVPVDGGSTDAPTVQNPFVKPGDTTEDIVVRLESIKSKLNQGQTAAFRKATAAMDEYEAALNDGRPFKGSPIFISGAGGCGKSFVIEAITLEIQRRAEEMDRLNTLILASTGAAAVLLGGATVHAGLGIRPDKSRGGGSKSLRAELKQSFQHKYQALRAVIIDEVSMVGQDLLYRVNERLNEIFEIRDPSVTYGGKIMIFVGDLLQLPAVRAKSVFDTEMSRRVGPEGAVLDLWREVKMVELTEVVRTRGDPKYGEVMSRVRLGVHSQDDVAYLEQRTLSSLGKKREDVKDIMHIFPTNDLVDNHNKEQMNALAAKWAAQNYPLSTYDTTVNAITVIADDMMKKHYKGDARKLAPPNINDCGGLADSLRLIRDMPIVFRQNIDVADGIANGSLATLRAWVPKKGRGQGSTNMPAYLLVHMKGAKGRVLGAEARKTFKKEEPQIVKLLKEKEVWDDDLLVPVKPAKSSFLCRRKKTLLTRRQFPVAPAFASTIHRVQGATFDELVMSLDLKVPRPALAYTALSRLTTHEGLFFIAFNPASIVPNNKAQVELQELRKRSGLPLLDLPPAVKEAAAKRQRLEKWEKQKRNQGKLPQEKKTPHLPPPSTSSSSLKETAAPITSATPTLQASSNVPRRLENALGHEDETLWNKTANHYFSKRVENGEREAAQLPSNIRLRNPANLCFANAAFQCLFHIPPLQAWANGATKRDKRDPKRRLAEHLRLLFLSGPTPSAKEAKNTKPVVKSYHRPDYPFYDGRQHDGVEFLQQILLESEISENGGPLNCGFWSITTCRNPLCIRQPYPTNETGGAALIVIKRPRGKSQLKDIINSQLTEDVAANCADCNTVEMAKKKELKFSFMGDYSILCLSPFHAEGRTEGNVGTVRANGFIAGFDQDNVAIDGTKFRAIAAAEHIGRSLDSGHYVAYLRQPDSQWLYISDDQTPTLRPHLPLGLHNIYYVVLQKLANQNNPQDEEYQSSPIDRDLATDVAEHLQLELLEAEFYGLSYFKDIPTRPQILRQLELMKQRASQHSCWYLHHSGEIVIFTRQEKGPYKKVPVKFNGAFGVLRKVEEDDGELETFYLVLKKGTQDYCLVFAAMKKKDWPKAESYIRGLLNPLPDIPEPSQSAPPSAAATPPQSKKKREHVKANAPVSPSTASPLKKVVRSSSGLWTGTAYGIWRTSKEQSRQAILSRLEKETARPRLHSFPCHLLQDSAAHTFDLVKRIDSRTSQLVQRFEVHEVRLLELVAEKPRRFVLVIQQAPGWFHLFAKLNVCHDPAALEKALVPSSSPPSANSRDDLTPASSILQRQGELSYISWIKWAQTRKIHHQRYTRANYSTSINSRIFLFSGDIVSLKVDMITNAANPQLMKGDGIDDHIHKAAGWDPANSDYKLRLYCKKLGGCPVGSAKVTPSFDIGSLHSGAPGWIAHAVGPNCRLPFADTGKEMYETERGRVEAQRLLTSAYTAALQCALDVGAKSIALPCISTGIYGFPSPDAADIAGAAVRHFLEYKANNRPLDVVFCLYSSRDEADYVAMMPRHFPLH